MLLKERETHTHTHDTASIPQHGAKKKVWVQCVFEHCNFCRVHWCIYVHMMTE